MERKLIDYLPYVVRDYDVLSAMMTGEQPEFDIAWAYADDLLKNQFIQTAGHLGLSRWEQILNIVPKGMDTLEDRRFRVLSMLNTHLPYTLPQLRLILSALCGPTNVKADIAAGSYTLEVRLRAVVQRYQGAVEALLERITPVNIVLRITQLFNEHRELSPFRHRELAVYTHYALRTENLAAGGNPTPHSMLSRCTHRELDIYTHYALRTENITEGGSSAPHSMLSRCTHGELGGMMYEVVRKEMMHNGQLYQSVQATEAPARGVL